MKVLNRFLNIYFFILLLVAIGISFYKADLSMLGLIGFFTLMCTFFFWFSIIGKVIQSLVATFFTLITLQLINQVKIYFFKSRLFFTDLLMISDSNNFDVIGQYWELYLIVIFWLVVVIVTVFIYRKGYQYKPRVRLISMIIAILGFVGIYQITLSENNVETWQDKLPNGKGVIINVWMTLNGMKYVSPTYTESDELFLNKADEIVLSQSPITEQPDIVVFLQESTVDRDYFDMPNKGLPKLSMFDINSDFVTAYSPMRVQTTGGGTWLTEFSFATGMDTNDFGIRKHSVFYTVAPHVQTSFYQELKNNGYYTVLLTPMTKDNYNTRNAYENFGIDLILQPQDLGYDAPINDNLWKITSHQMLEYVYQILEKYKDKPVAIFMLSMNEHGPYDATYIDKFEILSFFEDEKVGRRLNDYLDRQLDLNKATDNFSEKIMKRSRPTLFLYFGDHHPALYGKAVRSDLFNSLDYVTQFVMKDNLIDGTNLKLDILTDINFIGGIILERINAKVSPYYEANIKMRHLCKGMLEDCPNSSLVKSYKSYIYNTLKAAGS